MDETGFTGIALESSRVAIWGLGLMGGSLALALEGKCVERIGIDADPVVVALAIERGVVERAYVSPEDTQAALAGVDVLILAAPVRAILAQLEALPAVCAHPLVVMDLGSTKSQIMAVMDRLPLRFDLLGGHPMCGKEKASLRHAESTLYQQARFALVALERTSRHARGLAESLVRAIGSCPLWIEAEQHDRWVAATSHVPYLLASALAQSTPREVAPLVGPGFRSTARLAASPAGMMMDILATNSENVRAALRLFREQLETYETLLERGDLDGLAEHLVDAAGRLQDIQQDGTH